MVLYSTQRLEIVFGHVLVCVEDFFPGANVSCRDNEVYITDLEHVDRWLASVVEKRSVRVNVSSLLRGRNNSLGVPHPEIEELRGQIVGKGVAIHIDYFRKSPTDRVQKVVVVPLVLRRAAFQVVLLLQRRRIIERIRDDHQRLVDQNHRPALNASSCSDAAPLPG